MVIWEPYTEQLKARVAPICLSGQEIWMSRVPMVSWKRVEWHLPDRVLRQFGHLPTPDIPPMDPQFRRVDGRGKPDMDWSDYHQIYITLWDNRRGCIVFGPTDVTSRVGSINAYMRWYRSWASLHLLHAPAHPPDTYYPRSPGEQRLMGYFLQIEEICQPYYGGEEDNVLRPVIDKIEELSTSLRKDMYIADTQYQDRSWQEAPYMSSSIFPSQSAQAEAGPSTFPDQGPSASSYDASYPYVGEHTMGYSQPWPSVDIQPLGTPSTQPAYWMPPGETPVEPLIHTHVQLEDTEGTEDDHDQHQLRGRPVRPPSHYTPGTDALPRKPRRKK